MFTFWNYYVLKLVRLETFTFSDARLSDMNVVLCYVLSQYRNADVKENMGDRMLQRSPGYIHLKIQSRLGHDVRSAKF
jgi:hypothetical protein